MKPGAHKKTCGSVALAQECVEGLLRSGHLGSLAALGPALLCPLDLLSSSGAWVFRGRWSPPHL